MSTVQIGVQHRVGATGTTRFIIPCRFRVYVHMYTLENYNEI